jgi:hypothetical protein
MAGDIVQLAAPYIMLSDVLQNVDEPFNDIKNLWAPLY